MDQRICRKQPILMIARIDDHRFRLFIGDLFTTAYIARLARERIAQINRPEPGLREQQGGCQSGGIKKIQRQ